MYVQYILIIFSPMGPRQQSPLTEEQLALVAGQGGVGCWWVIHALAEGPTPIHPCAYGQYE